MDSSPSSRGANARLLGVTSAIALLGFVVRYYDVQRQVILDDEWHSIRRAANSSFWQALTTYARQATAIPSNAYNRAILDLVGWSELALRLPSIVASVATLVAL